MNKLVSRNPVQRFKEGRKILKGADGLKANEYGEQAYFLDRNGRAFKGHIDQSPENKRLTQRYILNGKQYGSFDGGKQYYDLSSLKPLNYKSNQYLLSKINYKPIETKDKNKRNTIITPVDNYYLKGFENRKDEIAKLGGVRAVQKMLGFTEGNGLDGKWGQNTEDAYLKYLVKFNDPGNILQPSTSGLTTSIIQPTPEAKAIISGLDYSDKWKYPEMNVSIPENYVPTSLKANRSDIREVIRKATGKGAYDFTGAQRKALRQYINGEQYNANDLAAFGNLGIFNKYKPGFYKQGGNMLPSRNIVERFKQRNFR